MTDGLPFRRLAGMGDVGLPDVDETPELVERREAVADLGAALRELVANVVSTEVAVEELRRVTADARRMAETLAARQRGREQLAAVDDLHRGLRMFNPVIGPGNPLAPPLRVEIIDGEAVGTCTLSLAYEGPHTFGHGGVSALLMDQILGYATAVSGHPGVTGRLMVRYLGPVPLQTPLSVRGKAVDVLGSRVTARGTIRRLDDPDTPLVEGEGRFMTLRPEQARRLFGPALRPGGADPLSLHD